MQWNLWKLKTSLQKSHIFFRFISDTGAQKALVPTKGSKVKAKPSKVSKVSKVIAMPISSKKKKKSGRGSGPSDGDSIVTEDFENQFHNVSCFCFSRSPWKTLIDSGERPYKELKITL